MDKGEPGTSQCTFLKGGITETFTTMNLAWQSNFKKHAGGFGCSFMHDHGQFWDRDSLESFLQRLDYLLSELQGSCLCLHCASIKNTEPFYFLFFFKYVLEIELSTSCSHSKPLCWTDYFSSLINIFFKFLLVIYIPSATLSQLPPPSLIKLF